MPEVSRFYGIRIYLYFNDHGVPHFHAKYGGLEASIAIDSAETLGGDIHQTARRLVREWASLHKDELGNAWFRCRRDENPGRIPPLE